MDGGATAIRLEIRLEIRLDGERPVGRAYARGGSREFAGWLGLVATIEHLLTATPPPAESAPAPEERTGQ